MNKTSLQNCHNPLTINYLAQLNPAATYLDCSDEFLDVFLVRIHEPPEELARLRFVHRCDPCGERDVQLVVDITGARHTVAFSDVGNELAAEQEGQDQEDAERLVIRSNWMQVRQQCAHAVRHDFRQPLALSYCGKEVAPSGKVDARVLVTAWHMVHIKEGGTKTCW